MDDQRQGPSELSPKKVRSKRKAVSASQPNQPSLEQQGNILPPVPGQNPAEPQPRLTRQLPPSQSNHTRQIPRPQPILFPEVEVDIEVTGDVDEILLRPQRLRKTRRWLRSRSGRIVVPVVALILGLAIGLSSIVWYGLSGAGPVILVPKPAPGNLIIEADKAFVTQLVRQDLANAGLPGQVSNVTVTLARGSAMTIQGDDNYSVLGVTLSRHFTVDTQLYVRSCIMQVRVTRADLGGIPVTGFVQNFEGNINKELAQKPTGLPEGFTYCTVGVRTEPAGLFITYKAVAAN
ncbi:MAG TPA: hypothetical protein VFN35_00800 [Ktedonobacteraceae bacterium]|nr:hypothetical protein [Ktedonobacteraceae bacterium]